ncbi:hypothetical protein LTR49_028751, partial [Elasticomyces elasticus]
ENAAATYLVKCTEDVKRSSVAATSYPRRVEDEVARLPILELAKAFIVVMKITQRPWWRRIWVVQEFALSQRQPVFLLGPHKLALSDLLMWADVASKRLDFATGAADLPFEDFRRDLAVSLDGKQIQRASAFCGTILSRMHGLQDNSKQGLTELVHVLLEIEDREAREPHDYVYGLLGLMSPGLRQQFVVDYGIPHWQLYQALMAEAILHGSYGVLALHLTSLHGSREHRDRYLVRSWVPDLRAQSRYDSALRSHRRMTGRWRPPTVARLHQGQGILLLQGVLIDVITFVDTPLVPNLEHIRSAEARLSNSPINVQSLRIMLTKTGVPFSVAVSESVQEALWQCMLQGDVHLKTYKELFQRAGREMAVRATQSCDNTSLLATKTGLQALSDSTVTNGDVIVCWRGSSTMFVLRPKADYYIIIGTARVAGLQEPEAVDRYCEECGIGEAVFRVG